MGTTVDVVYFGIMGIIWNLRLAEYRSESLMYCIFTDYNLF